MPYLGILTQYLLWILLYGLVVSVDINFEERGDGYFLKTVYQKHQAYDPLRHSEDFVISQPLEEYVLTASAGPYTTEQKIPHKLVKSVINSAREGSHAFTQHDVIFDHDVTAHIVSEHLSQKWPKLQVLFHASPNSDFKSSTKRKSKSRSRVASERPSVSSMCGHLYINNNNQELSSICVLSAKDNACVTSITLPTEWWHDNATVKVSYRFSQADINQECASASNSIVPGRSFENSQKTRKQLITSFHLSPNEERFKEESSEGIVIRVPTDTFSPGTIFEIPVLLQENSYIQNFIMSARVRQGLKITGAIAKADGPWQIHVDIRDKKNVATVTAYLKDPSLHNNVDRLQDVFKWQLKVDDNVTDVEASRIMWSIKYEHSDQKEIFLSAQPRLVARINIRGSESEKLVTVLKRTELLNFAMLTGQPQIYPLKLYKVSETDDITDVTQDSACHSAETDVLKVAHDCSSVYLDGTERRGSHNVTIITKSGRHTGFTFVRVWMPMDPVDIKLSDTKLSHIRSWKVNTQKPKSKGRSRNRRVVDFGMLTHPSVYLSKKGKKFNRGRCKLRLQQALLDVYAKFFIAAPTGIEYYKGRQASLKVTDLLMKQLRVSDSRIVSLNGRVLQGLSQGRSEVQVLSPNGRVMAAKEIRVGGDKVSVERLIITLVSGITMEIQLSDTIQGAMSAVAHIQTKLQRKYKDAVLDITIQFSDQTRFPLKYVAYQDYFLEVSLINQHIIGLAPYSEDRPYEPKIVALNEGRGECLRVILKVGDKCLKKRSTDLALDHVFVESDFSLANQVYNDRYLSDGYYGDNRASDRQDHFGVLKKPPFKLSSGHKAKMIHSSDEEEERDKFSKGNKKSSQESQVIPFPSELANKLPQESPQTKTEPVKTPAEQSGLTPLQIGMYVLLAVFCVAISVFLVNCIVFMVRYRRKRKPRKKHKEPVYQANDWVWIGRATLERNAINTQCSQSLMPAEDFNGNHTRPASRGNSASNSAQSSNRNSFVSTIKGSECSIRITANPLPEEDSGETSEKAPPDSAGSQSKEPKWDYEAMGLTYEQLADYFDNLRESSA